MRNRQGNHYQNCYLGPIKFRRHFLKITNLKSQLKVEKIKGGKVCSRCKGKTLLGIVNKLMKTKKYVDITKQCFASLPQVDFPANNLNFH